MKRGRNQRRRPGGGNNPNRALDSNGPDVRIRGTANQIYDKYQALARDASSAGDRVKAESYLQHAEHYFRLIRSMQPAQPAGQQPGQQPAQQSGEAEGEQPSIAAAEGEGERPQREPRKPRERQKKNTEDSAEAKAPEEEGADKVETSSAETEEAAPPEEEKKPRRRRAPRRAKKADEENAETPATAAAE